jgi:transketolase
MSNYALNPKVYDGEIETDKIRAGFGRGLKVAGQNNEQVVALCADLTDSVQFDLFSKEFKDRFIQIGIAEQNLVTVASGLALVGKIPFAGSYAAFSPGRNWEQIKTTIALNNQPVKIIGGHAGLVTGPDGATHQMLEDIALMRAMPNMIVVVPGDAIEAEKATLAIAQNGKPSYLRLSRPAVPTFSVIDSPFEVGKAYVLRDGRDVSLIGCGILTYQLLKAAQLLSQQGIEAEVVHSPTIKPLDDDTVIETARRTGRIVTAEEAQIIGGLGGAVSEALGAKLPTPILRIGVNDRYGESGESDELIKHFGLDFESIARRVSEFVSNTPQYHRDY